MKYRSTQQIITLFGLLLAASGAWAHCAGKHSGNHPHCGGGGDGGDSGDPYPLICTITDDAGDTVRSDGLGDYVDGDDRAECTTGGTTQPNASGLLLDTIAHGPIKRAIRKIDLAFNGCAVDNDCNIAPLEFFQAGATSDDMEDMHISLRPYPEDGHIQNLPADDFYSMALSIGLEGYAERWAFQIRAREVPPEWNDGAWCKPANPADAVTDFDVNVYLWPDANSDGTPDGYTVTTGTFDDTSVQPPIVTPGATRAVFCSNVGPISCDGTASGNMCNILGEVDVQFTWHSENK